MRGANQYFLYYATRHKLKADTKNQGWTYWGGGVQGGAIFHDKANNY
jgi:hypothetical protein